VYVPLPLHLVLLDAVSNLIAHQLIPFHLSRCALAHRTLEGQQLSHSLQIFDRLNSLPQKIGVRIGFSGFFHDGFKEDGILLQMFRRASEEVLEIEAAGIRMPSALLEGIDNET
jgi:hypothetical protein